MTNGQGVDLTHKEYKDGNTLISSDLNPLDYNDTTLLFETTGTVKLELTFSSRLTEAHTLQIFKDKFILNNE